MSSSLKSLKNLDDNQLKDLAMELIQRMESIVDECTDHGIDLDKFIIWKKDENGKIDEMTAPIPDCKALQKYIKTPNASSAIPVLVGGICELTDIILETRLEMESR